VKKAERDGVTKAKKLNMTSTSNRLVTVFVEIAECKNVRKLDNVGYFSS